MRGSLRLLGVMVAGLLAGLAPAHATGNFLCEADDASLKFTAESTFSHGLGEVFMGFKAALSVRVKDTPKDFADLELDAAQLAHHWFAGRALNLHLYREREASAPHGYVELIVETQQSEDDETAFAGDYKLVVFDVGAPSDSEGKTWRAEGKVSCSVG
jgi:hypothetical protein